MEWLTEQPTARSIVRLIGRPTVRPYMTQFSGLHSLSNKQEDGRLPNRPAGQTTFYLLGWLVSQPTTPMLQRLTIWLVI